MAAKEEERSRGGRKTIRTNTQSKQAKANSNHRQTEEKQQQNLSNKCVLLRNLPAGISDRQLSSWFAESFQQQTIRTVHVKNTNSSKAGATTSSNPVANENEDAKSSTLVLAGSYLAEVSSPSIRNQIIAQKEKQNREEPLVFTIKLKLDRCRSDKFAKTCFLSEAPSSSNTSDDTEEDNSNATASLAGRCLLIQEVMSDDAFPLTEQSTTQLFQGCMGVTVRRQKIIRSQRNPSRKATTKEENPRIRMMVELESEEAINSLLETYYNNSSSSLAIPVRLVPVKSDHFARSCLLKVKAKSEVSRPQKRSDLLDKAEKENAELIARYHEFESQARIEKQELIRNLANAAEDIEKAAKENDRLLKESKKVETDLKSKLAFYMKENTRQQTELKDQQRKHEKQCLVYKNQLAEATEKLDASTKRLEQRPEPSKNLHAYEQKVKAEYGAKLKKELAETQEKLKQLQLQLQQKNRHLACSDGSRVPEAPSLADWLAPNLTSSKKTENVNTASTSIPKDTRLANLVALVDFESAAFAGEPPTFHEADAPWESSGNKAGSTTNDGEQASGSEKSPKRDPEIESRQQIEWECVRSMYTAEDIWMSDDGDRICRRMLLPIDKNNTSKIAVDVVICVPREYLAHSDSVLGVDASLAPKQETKSSNNFRKVVVDALPQLRANCRWEAKVHKGEEAILAILTCAEAWLQNDWRDILDKEVKSNEAGADGVVDKTSQSQEQKSFVMGRMLLESHHITDPDKVKMVKVLASQYDLGCCVKTGRPGLVLLEGFEENCKACASELMKNRVKQRAKNGKDTATFAIRGAVTATVSSSSELENQRTLSSRFEELDKTRMSEFERKCSEVGLQNSVPSIR